MVVDRPSLFEFLGYLMFAPAFIVGPIFEFSDYKNYVEEKDVFSKIPSTLLPCLKIVAQALLWLVAMIGFSTYFKLDFLITEEYG